MSRALASPSRRSSISGTLRSPWVLVTTGAFFLSMLPIVKMTDTSCTSRTWQDWGLRMARKTAFHAAVQHYCRQLGVTTHASPIPVVYADPVTLEVSVTSPPLDDDGGVLSPASAIDGPAVAEDTEPVRPALGFVSPESQRAEMRARKTRRKAVLRSMGAGAGGD